MKKQIFVLLLLSAGMLMPHAIIQAASINRPPSGPTSLINQDILANDGYYYEEDLNGCGPAFGSDC